MLKPRDLPLLVVFVAVARSASFTVAARELGLSKSVVSEHIRTLEERCGVRLIERTTRCLKLTQVGAQVLEAASSVSQAARAVHDVLEEHRDAPVGTLRIASTHDLNHRFVAPIVARLTEEHPELRVDLVCDEGPQDLIAGGIDVAVCLGNPLNSEFLLRRLKVFNEVIVAAPALAAQYRHARRPADLVAAPWVRHTTLSGPPTWTFRGHGAELDELRVSVRGGANTADGIRSLLLAGVGFGVLPQCQVTDDLARGALIRVCPRWIRNQLTLYAVLPSAKHQPKRARLFIAALRDAIADGTLGGDQQSHEPRQEASISLVPSQVSSTATSHVSGAA